MYFCPFIKGAPWAHSITFLPRNAGGSEAETIEQQRVKLREERESATRKQESWNQQIKLFEKPLYGLNEA